MKQSKYSTENSPRRNRSRYNLLLTTIPGFIATMPYRELEVASRIANYAERGRVPIAEHLDVVRENLGYRSGIGSAENNFLT